MLTQGNVTHGRQMEGIEQQHETIDEVGQSTPTAQEANHQGTENTPYCEMGGSV